MAPLLALLLWLTPPADASSVLKSAFAKRDFALGADPQRAEWSKAPRVIADRDYLSHAIQGKPMEIRSRWTKQNLYLLYICPYDGLSLKPNPDSNNETPQLWNWEVAEAFIGSDFQHIARYKEFEVSPQSEWSISISTARIRRRNRG